MPVALLLLALAAGAQAAEPVWAPAVWSAAERQLLLSLALPGPPPPSPSNRVADDPRAATFGRALFFDRRLSGDGRRSCASCHDPQRHYSDGRQRALGVAELDRNTPSLIGTAYQSWFYWDGRRDSLWAQALVPFEAPAEMAGSRLAVVRTVGNDTDYRRRYRALFGAFPPALLAPQLPVHAGPLGDAAARRAWDGLSHRQQQQINTVYANLGKTIAAFERTLLPAPSRFDDYLYRLRRGDPAAGLLSDAEIAGLRLFIDAGKTRCLQCHNGPLLSNGGFHNIGSGNFDGPRLDFGRRFGLAAVLRDEFNCLGPYSDAAPDDCLELRFLNRAGHQPLAGAFKTPTLRNVAATAPYFHDGRFASLRQVLSYYNDPPAQAEELRPLRLTTDELDQLEAFLSSLSEPVAPQVDRTWSPSELALIDSLRLAKLSPPPPDPGNQYGDSAAAAALGEALFFEQRLSRDGSLSCAGCHDPARAYGDGRARPSGVTRRALKRNAPALRGVAWRRWLYWDGRKDSLWSQTLEPLEAPAEMGLSRAAAVKLVAEDAALAALYRRAFDTPAVAPEVAAAGPLGSAAERAAWSALTPGQRSTINSTFTRMGKALAAFLRTLRPVRSRFDDYADALLAGDRQGAAELYDNDQTAGLQLFLSGRSGCSNCHLGPLFSDGEFRNIGSGGARQKRVGCRPRAGRRVAAADRRRIQLPQPLARRLPAGRLRPPR